MKNTTTGWWLNTIARFAFAMFLLAILLKVADYAV